MEHRLQDCSHDAVAWPAKHLRCGGRRYGAVLKIELDGRLQITQDRVKTAIAVMAASWADANPCSDSG